MQKVLDLMSEIPGALWVIELYPASNTKPITIRVEDRVTVGRRLARLREKFEKKRSFTSEVLSDLGFEIYNSGSAFYLWARIPRQFDDAIAFNEMLMRDAGVGMTPGSAFADGDLWDAHVRVCIAREDSILEGSMEKLQTVLGRIDRH